MLSSEFSEGQVEPGRILVSMGAGRCYTSRKNRRNPAHKLLLAVDMGNARTSLLLSLAAQCGHLLAKATQPRLCIGEHRWTFLDKDLAIDTYLGYLGAYALLATAFPHMLRSCLLRNLPQVESNTHTLRHASRT